MAIAVLTWLVLVLQGRQLQTIFHPVVDAGCTGESGFGVMLGVFFLRNNIVCYLEQKTRAVITTCCAPWSKSLIKADSIFKSIIFFFLLPKQLFMKH